jgi:hypothetical protein
MDLDIGMAYVIDSDGVVNEMIDEFGMVSLFAYAYGVNKLVQTMSIVLTKDSQPV